MGTIQEPTPGPRPRPDGDLPLDITRPNRKAIASTVKDTEARRAAEAEERVRERAAEIHRDSVDVSPAAKLLARGEARKAELEDARRKRVAELKDAHEKGTLHTKARTEKAAQTMLGA
jgi:anti-sigma28 factor (negative regulator of flagellin synthesis)